ncbi:MAG: hypothetical protein M1819_001893 [Sarea resinae]|nr:MAG: hypothetical protein M1819_001893 [Sarea resinae]
MCNGESGRKSDGGRIAVMFSSSPALDSVGDQIPSRNICNFVFNNDEGNSDSTTRAAVRISDDIARDALHGSRQCSLQIDRNGDLTDPLSSAAGQPLHSFPFELVSLKGHSDPDYGFDLPERLDLGVGGRGIVGRKIRLLCGGERVGEGVIGFN